MNMNITKTNVINPGTGEGEKPDAVKIEIAGVTVLVNLHTGVTSIDGSEHATAGEGENNTLEIHACPSLPSFNQTLSGSSFEQMLAGFSDLQMTETELAPGLRIGIVGMPGSLADLIGGGLGGFRTS